MPRFALDVRHYYRNGQDCTWRDASVPILFAHNRTTITTNDMETAIDNFGFPGLVLELCTYEPFKSLSEVLKWANHSMKKVAGRTSQWQKYS